MKTILLIYIDKKIVHDIIGKNVKEHNAIK